MLESHGFHGGRIGPSQASDDFASAQVRANDFRDVGHLQFVIPHAIGVSDEDGSFLAEAKAAAGGELDVVVEALGEEFPFEGAEDLPGAAAGATGDTFGLVLSAYEDVMMKRFHGVSWGMRDPGPRS